jgi:6-phospho-beta-glucosidase/maltose-6'-phosphate glucosidase
MLEEKQDRDPILCVRNDGALRDLPEDCSVEVPVRISKQGLEPRRIGDCPRFLRGLFHSVKESDRLIVEAVRHKSYESALQALTINPLVPSLDAARGFLDRIIREESIELY